MSSAEPGLSAPRPTRRRRRREQGLERVLGTPALFATAYGNVGSSIYYALGVTAVFALGLTPVVFVVAGIIFAATALTYTEGTVRYPEAGGSASFARHAFNELVSFGAGWAQMLNYIITIAISAFFVPHYLSIFWGPLRENPWDIVGGIVVIVVLVALNVVGIKEAAGLNIFLAVIDFATQLLLVLLGFALIFSPSALVDNVELGVAPTWGQFFLAVPVAMIAYTGIETISNLAEEARNPPRDIPNSIRLVSAAVFAIYFTLPMIALSALPVEQVDGDFQTRLGLPPEEGGYANDPVLGLVKNLDLHGIFLDSLEIYVGVLAATILFIATNAGVIGASRITYSMASYRQLPEVFRRLHPRFKTPWLALVFFAGVVSIAVILPGQTTFLGTMYSFGAMLSFTIAHVAVIALRVRRRDEELVYRARPNLRFRGIDWPLFALFGGLGTAAAWFVVVVQEESTRWVGLGWIAIGFVAYAIYRRRVVRVPLRETVRAPAFVLGPALTVAYRTIVVPVQRTAESEEALVAAARLASERGATVVVVYVIEVPMDLPLDADLPEHEAEGEAVLDSAQELLESYGVRAVTRLVRARSAGPAIVEEADRRNAELIVLGAPRTKARRGKPIFGRTVDYVLKHSPTRVLIAAGKRAA
ncbi:MAG TPA: universal stress protein [Gaiellaceae bacterium]|nr:universal stress protein [Gaiellaceae bacterium]